MPRPSLASLALVGLLAACSRRVPDPPLESPLASESPAPRAASVDVALTSDPPLPGEAREGWSGLVDPPKGGGHHHHHHAKPKPTSSPTSNPTEQPATQETGHAH